MKITKLILTLVLFFSLNFIYAQARGGRQGLRQGPPPIPNNAQIEQMVNSLAKEITLSNEQKTEVLSLYKAHFSEVKAKLSGSNRPKREEMEALKKAFENKVKALLTKDQVKKYEQWAKKQGPQQRRR